MHINNYYILFEKLWNSDNFLFFHKNIISSLTMFSIFNLLNNQFQRK